MPYVARNKSGAIIAVFRDKNECARERVSSDDRELRSFLGQNRLPERAQIQAIERVRLQHALQKSDADFVSVLDDLIIALLKKEVIVFTDLPAEAGQKLMDRQQNRGEPTGSISLAAREQLA